MNELRWLAIVVLVSASAACSADRTATAPNPPASPSVRAPELLRGWYRWQPDKATFESCGQLRRWQVDSAELRRQSKAFADTHGVEGTDPVYVVLLGAQSADGANLTVLSVKQFGSATPVRDCGLTGVIE